MATVSYASLEMIPSFYECLKTVAAERVYIEMIEPPPLDKVVGFQSEIINQNGPVYYAIDQGRVVGWCDSFPSSNPRLSHRAHLGMGLLPEYRGKGLGSQLLKAALAKAKEFGLEKVELSVYTTNTAAVALYKKFGFVQEGLIKNYRKLDGQYFDCYIMGVFL